jgi:hypothetical protein
MPDRLRCRIRLADGRLFAGELAPERHRALQLTMLHADTREFVELTPGTRAPGGKVQLDRRWRAEHFLPGGASETEDWLDGLLEHARRIVAGGYAERRFDGKPREEVFVGVAPRTVPRGRKDSVTHTRFLWVDIDRPEQLPALWAFLAERPCHLLVASAGSGGMHAYFKLDRPLAALRVNESTGETIEVIERANARLIHRLGSDADGKPTVADPSCRKRSQPMRLGGTVNFKTGEYARVVHADFRLPPYSVRELVGDLPDPEWALGHVVRRFDNVGDDPDPYKRIPPPVYFEALAGIRVPTRGGLVRCPAPGHPDEDPSCSVSADPRRGWCCHGGTCLARGAIYDLASVVLGGPWGRELRGEAFLCAHAYVVDAFGEITDQPQPREERPRWEHEQPPGPGVSRMSGRR